MRKFPEILRIYWYVEYGVAQIVWMCTTLVSDKCSLNCLLWSFPGSNKNVTNMKDFLYLSLLRSDSNLNRVQNRVAKNQLTGQRVCSKFPRHLVFHQYAHAGLFFSEGTSISLKWRYFTWHYSVAGQVSRADAGFPCRILENMRGSCGAPVGLPLVNRNGRTL